MRVLTIVFFFFLTYNLNGQIDLINDNIGIGLLNPIAPIHIKGDTVKMQNEAGTDLFMMRADGNIGIGKNPTGHKLDVNGSISSGGKTLFLGENILYGNNASALYLTNNHSTTTRLIMRDKENTLYGRLYGNGNGQNFGLLDGDGNWGVLMAKDNYTQLRINNTAYMQLDGGSTYLRPSQLQIGWGQTGNRVAYIDLQGDDTYSDYGLRLIRWNTGPNTISQMAHRGTGAFEILTVEASDLHLSTASANRLVVKGSGTQAGNVGIGTTNPSQRLHVNGSIQYSGSLINASDKRLKKNINNFEYGIKEVLKLNPVSYRYDDAISDQSGKISIGLIAQQLQKVAPELVTSFQQPFREQIDPDQKKEPKDYLAIEESAIKYMLINAIKEQQAQIDEQRKMIEELQHALTTTPGTIIEENSMQIALENSRQKVAPYISQNIPNPTEEDAIIKYFVPDNAHSALVRFYNLNGQVLKEVPITKFGQGEIDLKLEQMISGSYMYSLIVDGNLVDTKKMVVAK